MSFVSHISGPTPVKPKPPLSTFQQFRATPVHFIIKWLNDHQPPIELTRMRARTEDDQPKTRAESQKKNQITVVCISDTHNNTLIDIPPGDILLHAGDLSNKGTFGELQAQLTWLNTLPHIHKIVIAGNHDALLDERFVDEHPERISREDLERRDKLEWGDITYLNNQNTTLSIRGRTLAIYGSPMTPQCGTFGFQYVPIRDVWKNTIPDEINIVLTHGPPKGYLDQGGKGCEWLLRELWRTKPQLVVCGHIHGGRGRTNVSWDMSQHGRDFGGMMGMVKMAISILWWWFATAVLGKMRLGRATIVNAAIGKEESAGAIVVEM